MYLRFLKRAAGFFYSNNAKTIHEQVEDIEILRFLESDYVVDMVEVEAGSLAVDLPEDVIRVVNKINVN